MTSKDTRPERPDASKLHGDITAAELSGFLAYAQSLTDTYVHPRPISFPTSANKANWADALPDTAERDCYDSLRTAASSSNRLALFETWTKSWVGNPDWRTDPWHCWGAAILKNPTGYGKHLIIFDCEADMNQDFSVVRPRSFMLPTQLSFIKSARDYSRVDSVWYGNAGITPIPLHDVLHTVEWIESFASHLEPMFQGPSDPRFAGFAQVQRQ